jgi:ribonuclease HII
MYSVSGKYLLGVDEAGRGPLAGPVAVGVVAVPAGFEVEKEFPGVADSKKLSEQKRERVFELLLARANAGDVRYVVEFSTAAEIDTFGIGKAIHAAVARGVYALASETGEVEVLLDGSLKAPLEYQQQTIVRGDATVPLISLASIAAKVTRDHLMLEFAAEFPEYGFDAHKGYGTKTHYEALKKFGPCSIHRSSFLHLTK